jgi:electron transport complex protein RnfG
MKRLNMFVPAIRLSIVCLVVTLLLAATNELTREKIALQVEASGLVQKQMIFPEGVSFTVIDLEDATKDAMDKDGYAVSEVSIATDANGQVLGYVFVSDSFGYAGNIVATTGINTDGQIVMVRATAANDTPNLGKKVEEDAFLSQFTGLGTDMPTGVTEGTGIAKIDAVSSATISSKAATAAINKAIGAYAYLLYKEVIS